VVDGISSGAELKSSTTGSTAGSFIAKHHTGSLIGLTTPAAPALANSLFSL